MYVQLKFISHHLCYVSVTIREPLVGRKSSSHRPSNIGAGHNAQPGEEEPRSFFDIGGSGDLTGSAALFLAMEVNQFCHQEISLDGVVNQPTWDGRTKPSAK